MRDFVVGQTAGIELIVLGLIAVAAFLLMFSLTFAVLRLQHPLRRRLARLRGEHEEPSLILRPGVRWPWLERRLLPRSKPELEALQRLLGQAGWQGEQALFLYAISQPILALLLGFSALIGCAFYPMPGAAAAFALIAAGTGIGYLMPAWWLRRRVAERTLQLRESFPDALDLLTVCVEAGLGLSAAIQRVSEELMISHPLLGRELGIVNAEMRAGVDRTQALRNLASRTGLQDIRGLVALLIQTMRLGTSIGDALRVYSAEFRDRRLQLAEEQAAMIGTKLTFPLVLCLFPGFFIVAVGPAAIKIIGVFGALAH